MSVEHFDEMSCPICMKANHCGVADPAGCWCMQEAIPTELIDLVPVESKGQACICAACVAAFASNQGLFKP